MTLFITKACFSEDDHYLWDELVGGWLGICSKFLGLKALVGDGWPRSHKKVA